MNLNDHATPEACPGCGCMQPGAQVHAIVAALREDDLDLAIESGLFDCARCEGCSDACTTRLLAARAQRLNALAARERYRARATRLERRAQLRAARRGAAPSAAQPETRPPLPSAAAAALARAKAKAAERGPR